LCGSYDKQQVLLYAALTVPLGRPKNGWEYDIRNDMKKLKIKNWTSYIQDCSKWKLYVEKAKMFKD
jgi:hypothetical protein